MLNQINANNLTVIYAKMAEYSNFLKNDKFAHISKDMITLNLALGWLGNFIYFVTSFRLRRKSYHYIYLYYILFFDTVSCVKYIFWPVLEFKNLGLTRKYGIAFYMANIILSLDEICSINVNYMTVVQVIDRSMAICKPYLYNTYFTFKRIMIITTSITFCNILIAIPCAVSSKIQLACLDYLNFNGPIGSTNQNDSYYSMKECKDIVYFLWPIIKNWRYKYDMIVLFFMYLLPVVIVVAVNVIIIVVMYKPKPISRTNPTKEIKRETVKTKENLDISIIMMNTNANRSKIFFRFYKLVLAQCIVIMFFNLPYIIYIFFVGSIAYIKYISELKTHSIYSDNHKIKLPFVRCLCPSLLRSRYNYDF
ncbi:unnamed protein product [Gordionus sp. m RMFG-2023]